MVSNELDLIKKQHIDLKTFHENFVLRTEEERRIKDEETRLHILNCKKNDLTSFSQGKN